MLQIITRQGTYEIAANGVWMPDGSFRDWGKVAPTGDIEIPIAGANDLQCQYDALATLKRFVDFRDAGIVRFVER